MCSRVGENFKKPMAINKVVFTCNYNVNPKEIKLD
jgi:hypothetical protein